MSAEYHDSYGIYIITFDDGSISMNDAHTMKPFNNEQNEPNVVRNLAQAGYYYPQDTPGTCIRAILLSFDFVLLTCYLGLHSAFSPDICIAISLDEAWTPHMRWMDHPSRENGEPINSGKLISITCEI